MVRLEKTPSPNGSTYLAEGPETGLSIFAALGGGDVRITLGKSNFGNIDPKQTSHNIVLCLDNDGQNPHTETLTHRVAEKLKTLEKTVLIAKPEEVKQDYNDVLVKEGMTAVAKAMMEAIPYRDYLEQKQIHLSSQSAITTHSAKVPSKAIEKNPEPEL
jgi:hypothetical protein